MPNSFAHFFFFSFIAVAPVFAASEEDSAASDNGTSAPKKYIVAKPISLRVVAKPISITGSVETEASKDSVDSPEVENESAASPTKLKATPVEAAAPQPSKESPKQVPSEKTESDFNEVEKQKSYLRAAISNTSFKPEVTEPEVTEPEVTEPEVNEPEVNEPEVNEPSPPKPLFEVSGIATPASYVAPSRSSWRDRYELGPGDELNFGLHGKPTLKKLAVAVAPDGTISYLQAKQIDVRGKTIDELRHQLNAILADYHRNARVIITPSKLGSKQYTVLGEVRKNGTYSLDRPVTLLQALAEAGGFNLGKSGEGAVQLADLRRSFVVRDGSRMPVDMESLYLAGDMTQNVHVEPGDYIYVASKLRNEVYVFGSVNTPGVKAIESRMTTLGAIAAAEGFSSQAWRDRVLIIRGKMDDPETIVMPLNKVLHGKSHDIEILPGDIVYVHNRPWAYATKILDAAILAYIDGSFAGWLADDGNIAVTAGS